MSYENVAERVLRLGREQAKDASDLLEVLGSLVYEFIQENDYADQNEIPADRAEDRQIFQLYRLILLIEHIGDEYLRRMTREGTREQTRQRLESLMEEVKAKGAELDAYEEQLAELARQEAGLAQTRELLKETRGRCEKLQRELEEWEKWKQESASEASGRTEELRNEYLTLCRIWNAYREDPFAREILAEQAGASGLPEEIRSVKELEAWFQKTGEEAERSLRLLESMVVHINRSLEEVTSDERN